MFLTLGVIALIIAVVLYNTYCRVIRAKNNVMESLSGIDVQLKKRHDLIPNILTIAKRFMEHEKELFEKVTELRTQAMKAPLGSKAKFVAEDKLDSTLGQLMVSVENYPELKSDQTMVQAMKTYNEVEEHISAARRFYNSALTEVRNTTQIFPGTLFANLAADVLNYSYFETDETSRQAINASDYL